MRRFVAFIVIVMMTLSASPAVAAGSETAALAGTGSPYKSIEDALDAIEALSLDRVDMSALIDAAISGAVGATGDIYSHYLPEDQLTSFSDGLSGGYYGIGVTMEAGMISTVRPGGPADMAGLRAGDRLVSVDDRDVAQMSGAELQSAIRGDDATVVTIVVERAGVSLTYQVRRGFIKLDTVAYRLATSSVGVIAISEFSEQTAADVDAAVAALQVQGAKSLIIDLRDNPGGLVASAVDVADQFIEDGKPIVHVYGRAINGGAVIATPGAYAGKLVILVNRNTASASEILTGALKESAGATVVGETTYGKGRFQWLLPLDNGGAIDITVGRYLTPMGNNLDGKGVAPDIQVTDPRFAYMPETALTPKRALKQGIVGLDVLALEEQLRFLGYVIDDPDGIYGSKTTSAERAFEREAGLPVDGIASVDDQTAALSMRPKAPTSDPIFEAGLRAAAVH